MTLPVDITEASIEQAAGRLEDAADASGGEVIARFILEDIAAQLRALRSALTARAWQPIETAPKSGTEILGWRADCGTIMVRWSCCAEMFTDEENDGLTEDDLWKQDWFAADFAHGARMDGDLVPTHWMPLPEDPK